MHDRIKSIDIMRGIAIICMILGHVYQIWTTMREKLFYDVITFISLFAPLFFVSISGISLYILIDRRIKAEHSKKEISLEVLKRAFFIFIVSLLFNLLFASSIGLETHFYFYILYWSMFQLIAISMLVFFILPFIRRDIRMVLYITLYFLIFIINHLILFYELETLYFLNAVDTSFPFLPWANLFLFGLLIGDIIINTPQETLNRYIGLFLLLGIIIMTIWVIWVQSITYLSLYRFVKGAGIFFIIFSILYYITDMKERNFYLKDTIIKWGNYSFTIYYFHYGIIVAAYIIIPFIFDFSKGIQLYQYLIILTAFFVSIEIFLRIWEQIDYKYGLEWCMRKFAHLSLFNKQKSE